MKFFDYFEDEHEYPKVADFAGIPANTLFSYISSTFLDGFINYVKPVKAYLVNRYRQEDGEWEVYKAQAQQLNNDFHTKLHKFGDDVLILAESDMDYWFFWYDCDVSDCMIGRFEKEGKLNEDVPKLFEEMINEHHYLDGSTEIKYSGWVSF